MQIFLSFNVAKCTNMEHSAYLILSLSFFCMLLIPIELGHDYPAICICSPHHLVSLNPLAGLNKQLKTKGCILFQH